MNGRAGEQGKGRRACNFCEWGEVSELVTHVCKSLCVFYSGCATTVNEFLERYDSILTYHVSVNEEWVWGIKKKLSKMLRSQEAICECFLHLMVARFAVQ